MTWPELEQAQQAELDARVKTTDWVRDIINKSAEEVAPRQLATMVVSLLNLVHQKAQ